LISPGTPTNSNITTGIADAKSLDRDTRERVFAIIMATSQVGIAIAGVDRIDRDNILNATLWAMAESVDRLGCQPRLVLVDGKMAPNLHRRPAQLSRVTLGAYRLQQLRCRESDPRSSDD
jgi:ribonuclease HII